MEDELITSVVMLFNGLVTIGFTPFLLRLYRRNRRNFYLLWGIGFLLYGLNIILRLFVTNPTDIEIEPLEWLVFLFYSFGFMNIITGVGDLIEKARLAFASSLILFLMPILVYYLPDLLIPAWMVTLSPYLIICVYLIFIRQRYRARVDLFVVGWVLLLLINISNPLGLIKPPYLDLLAIYGKIIIFFGMISPRFTYLADEIKQFLISGVPDVYPNIVNKHTFLVVPKEGNKDKEMEWIYGRIHENTRKGTRTVLVALYDLITLDELHSKGVDENNVYLVRLLPRGDPSLKEVQDKMATLDDNLYQLDILLSELIKFSRDRKIRCNIIFYTLSYAIHTHGIADVYSFIVSKVPSLKASNVQMHCFYYPDTHSAEDVALLEKLADEILEV